MEQPKTMPKNLILPPRVTPSTPKSVSKKKAVTIDSLYQLLATSGKLEMTYLSPQLPLLYLRAGPILKDQDWNALLISNPTNTTYQVELFSYQQEQWQKMDQITVPADPIAFDIRLKDFDFDGVKDIYIQNATSNGFVISRGELLLVDPIHQTLHLVQSASWLGNLRPDDTTNTVFSEEAIWCAETTFMNTCSSQYHWSKQELVFDQKKCPCVAE